MEVEYALAEGITGIRDMGSSFAAVREARDMITEGALGPRMFVSGPTLDGVLPNFPGIPPGVLTKIKTPAPGRMRQLNLQLTRMAAQGGIRLLAGTDWPGTSYGKGDYRTADRSSHRELQGLVERQSIIDKEMSLRRAEQPVRR